MLIAQGSRLVFKVVSLEKPSISFPKHDLGREEIGRVEVSTDIYLIWYVSCK